MPLYEYYCDNCAKKYEMLRPIARADDPATCPSGHHGGKRMLSVFAAPARGDRSATPMSGGGCACGGGGCGCAH